MLAGEARALARGWVEAEAAPLAGFQGAFMTGSAIWAPENAPMSPCSDVDVMVVLDGPLPPVKLGKVRHHGVLLCAGLRNPTVRTRYLAVRQLLADHGMLDRYELLLADLGCARLSRETVEHHLSTLEEVFDAAASVATTRFFFSSDISAVARPISIDGSRDLIARGYHREAVFWIVATYARCQTILFHDAPRELHDRFDVGFRELLRDLGIRSSADILARARRVEESRSRIWELAEAIMAANPAVQR